MKNGTHVAPPSEKTDTEFGKAIEYSVDQHTGHLGHNAEWMTKAWTG